MGRLGDMYGKQRMLLVAFVMIMFGTLLAAVANSLGVLVFARVVQGGGGGVFPLSFGIIRDEFPPDRVAGAIGLLSAIWGIGTGVGVLAGGLIGGRLSWHWLFWIPLVPLVAVVFSTWRFIPASTVRMPGKVNWMSGALLAGGLTAVLMGVSKASTWGWGSTKTVGLIFVGALLCVAWMAADWRSAEPLVDMRMMKLRGVWTTNLAAFLLGAGMLAAWILVPQFVETPKSTGFGFGASVLGGSLFLLPAAVTMLAMGATSGPIAKRFGSKAALSLGGIISMGAFGLRPQ
jgi:MFS family permease